MVEKIMKRLALAFVGTLGVSGGVNSPAHADGDHAVLKDPTGVCFRRLTWTDKDHDLKSHVEFVLVAQSSSLAKDVARIKVLSGPNSRANGPDVRTFTWIPVWINDDHIDATGANGPDCSNLLVAQPKGE